MVATTMAASMYAEQRGGVEGVQRARTVGANVWFRGCKHGVQEVRIGAGVEDAEIKLSSELLLYGAAQTTAVQARGRRV